MTKIKLLSVLIITLITCTYFSGCTSVQCDGANFDTLHGVVTDKRVDSWGQYMKNHEYIITMNDNNNYYEVDVNPQTYAHVKIGDTL